MNIMKKLICLLWLLPSLCFPQETSINKESNGISNSEVILFTQSTQSLDEKLKILEPMLNKIWEGELKSPDGTMAYKTVQKYEMMWEGKAIKYTSSIPELKSYSEGYFYWDRDEEKIAVIIINTNGIYNKGYVSIEEEKITIRGKINFPERSFDFRNSFEFLSENKMIDRWFQNAFGPWQNGHVVELTAGFIPKDKETPDSQILIGPYLGMKPPGKIPEIFAPGIISTRYHEHSYPAFSPDGKEVYWNTVFIDNYKYEFPIGILGMKLNTNGWSKPEYTGLGVNKESGNPCFSYDGQKIFFSSDEINQDGTRNSDIWYANKTTDGWDKAQKIPGYVNTNKLERQGTVTHDLTLYYLGNLQGVANNYGIYRSELKDGKYQKPELLPEKINSKEVDWTPFISPKEDYILWSSLRDGGFGSGDIYVSFRLDNGDWSDAINLGPEINKNNNERFPAVSPDGKYLFYVTDQVNVDLFSDKNLSFAEAVEYFDKPGNGMCDIYWVDAGIIEILRNKYIYE